MRRFRLLPWLLAAAVLALPWLLATWRPGNPDISWLMYVAGRMLDGARYGRNLMEINPPLIAWLMLPVAAFARVTGLAPMPAWQLALTLATAGVMLACLRLVPAGHAATSRPGVHALLLAVLFVLVPAMEAGQRDHLAALLALPYLLVLARRAGGDDVGRGTAVAAGIAGALGFLLKPHFLAALAAAEVVGFLLAATRVRWWRRPELVTLATLAVAYPLAALLLTPEWVGMARALGGGYTSILAPGPLELARAGAVTLVAVVLAVAGATLGAKRAGAGLEPILASAAAGWIVAVAAQRKPWSYLWIPPATLAWYAIGVGLLRQRPWAVTRGRALLRAALVTALVLVLAGYGARWAVGARAVRLHSEPESTYQRRVAAMRRYAGTGAVAALTPKHSWPFPAVPEAGVRWSLRLNSTWPLSALHPEVQGPGPLVRAVDRRAWAEPWGVLHVIAADLVADPPALLFVPVPDTAGANLAGQHRFDYLGLLAEDPDAARLLRGYACAGTLGGYAMLVPAGTPATGPIEECGLPTFPLPR